MLSGIRLRNIRSLLDSGAVEFKPITLLLGQNSSGKSSVLRSIPLLKQSLRTRSSAPILWYGDFVDFGSIQDVRSTLPSAGNVTIDFLADSLRLPSPFPITSDISKLRNARISLELVERDEATRVKSFRLSVGSDDLHVELDGKSACKEALLNGIDFTRLFPSDRYRFTTSSIIPQLSFTGRRSLREPVYYYGSIKPSAPGFREIMAIFQANLHGRISSGTLSSLVRRLEYGEAEHFLDRVKAIYSPLASWKRYLRELEQAHKKAELEQIRQLTFVAQTSSILTAFAQTVQQAFLSSAYIGPSRATGERYYRHQELAVDQIDAQGRNLPMFLYSLTPSQRDSFSDWLSHSIGYSLKVTRTAGHLQISLKENAAEYYHNIADMGYGFSQILPVLAQVWAWQHASSRDTASPFLAIEQPELHLHPAYQGRIADILCQSVNDSLNGNTSRMATFVVETHSEALINRLGDLIYSKVIPADMVAIYIFQRDSSTEATNITRSHFDSSGSLVNWPIGFFSSFA